MVTTGPVYDLSVLAQCNYHIHTNLSECARAEMTLASIIDCAEKEGLKTIALVDHHHCWTRNISEGLGRLKAELGTIGTKLNVLIGAELSAYGVGKYSDTLELNNAIDYRLYACNHFHLNFWEHPSKTSPRSYAVHTLSVLAELIKSGRADCIAHPFVASYLAGKLPDHTSVVRDISDNELGDILELGKKYGVAWEINVNAMMDDPGFARRYWKTGMEVGVEFRFGTDAHKLCDIGTRQFVDKLGAIINK